MTALTGPREMTFQMDTEDTLLVRYMEFPVAAGQRHFPGALVCTDATGFTVVPTEALDLVALGASVGEADNRNGLAGAINCKIQAGTYGFLMGAGMDTFTIADRGRIAYIIDDETAGRTSNGGIRSPLGKVVDVQGQLVFVEVGQSSLTNVPGTVDSQAHFIYQGPQPVGQSITLGTTDLFVNIRTPTTQVFNGAAVMFFFDVSLEDVNGGVQETWQADFQVLLDNSLAIPLGTQIDTLVNAHKFSSFRTVTSAITAGSHAVNLQMRKHQGAGSLTIIQNFDWSSLSFIELG